MQLYPGFITTPWEPAPPLLLPHGFSAIDTKPMTCNPVAKPHRSPSTRRRGRTVAYTLRSSVEQCDYAKHSHGNIFRAAWRETSLAVNAVSGTRRPAPEKMRSQFPKPIKQHPRLLCRERRKAGDQPGGVRALIDKSISKQGNFHLDPEELRHAYPLTQYRIQSEGSGSEKLSAVKFGTAKICHALPE